MTHARHAISGTVTFNGQPLDHGVIEFTPEGAGDGVQTGSVIAEGKYEIPEAQGLPPGKYKVVISSAGPGRDRAAIDLPGDAPPPSPERIPAKYNAQTELSIDVAPDSDGVYNFDLR
ncbi:MAG: carboxypeptidase regulatory-like domain-containing protein [Planctomycetes bacterium]|nr:carboxypeptidase regulatory-like domain-containing protein [Planctomycetota bacterium]